jgi:EmrB/QacA subfamily drug resistance transporter
MVGRAADKQATSTSWLRFGSVALALFCIQLDYFALSLALPVIADELGTTTTDLQWVVSGYMLALGALMIPASRLADLVGRKRILLVGLALFGLASLLCALAPSGGFLVAARVFQGVGGSMILPVAFSLISTSTTAEERPGILGVVIGTGNVGTALGPIVGGLLASTVGWRWVFLVNVPFAVASLLWGWRALRNSRDDSGHAVRDLDWLGIALVAVGVATFSYGLDSVSEVGLFSVAALGGLIIGVALLTIFARQERRHPWPLISGNLMRRRSFVELLLAGSLANVGYCVMIIVVTIQLQQVRGFSAAVAGAIFVAPAAITALCGPLSGKLAPRVAGGQVMAASIVLGSVGLLVQAFASSLIMDIVGLMITALCFGMGYSFTTLATQSVLPVDLAGEASGLVLTTLVTLGALGVIVGAVGIELFGPDLAAATSSTLLWTGVVLLVVGLLVGWTQRKATVAASSA